MTPIRETHTGAVRTASGLNLLAGFWLLISPWIYGAYLLPDAWNSWIAGFLIALFAAIRLAKPIHTAGLSWMNALLGIYVFISPWLFGYFGARFMNSLVVGAVVFLLAIWSATSTRRVYYTEPRV